MEYRQRRRTSQKRPTLVTKCLESHPTEGNPTQAERLTVDIVAPNTHSEKKHAQHMEKICSSCGKGNHFSRVCKSSRRVDAANIASSDSSDEDFFVGTIKTQQATAHVHAVDEDEWTSELEN